jgi:hypothetical protein
MNGRQHSRSENQLARLGGKLPQFSKCQCYSGTRDEDRQAHRCQVEQDHSTALPQLKRAGGSIKPRQDDRWVGAESSTDIKMTYRIE